MSNVKSRQTTELWHKFNLLNSLVIVHICLAANKSTKAESSNEILLFLFVVKLSAVQNQVETHKWATLLHRVKCFFIAMNMTKSIPQTPHHTTATNVLQSFTKNNCEQMLFFSRSNRNYTAVSICSERWFWALFKINGSFVISILKFIYLPSVQTNEPAAPSHKEEARQHCTFQHIAGLGLIKGFFYSIKRKILDFTGYFF